MLSAVVAVIACDHEITWAFAGAASVVATSASDVTSLSDCGARGRADPTKSRGGRERWRERSRACASTIGREVPPSQMTGPTGYGFVAMRNLRAGLGGILSTSKHQHLLFGTYVSAHGMATWQKWPIGRGIHGVHSAGQQKKRGRQSRPLVSRTASISARTSISAATEARSSTTRSAW